MDREDWKNLGQRVVVEPAARAGARALVRYVPIRTLASVGLGRRTIASMAAPIVGAFVVGAAAGAGAMLFFAPGSAEVRKNIAARIEAARRRIRHEEASAAGDGSSDDHDHEHDHGSHANHHDEHGRPRRRSIPRA